jgi:hypothetical protein
VTVDARADRAREVVRRWAETTMGWGPDQAEAHPAPHLSTPRFVLVVLTQRGARSGSDLYVMTDGDRVLPTNAANLGAILVEEGFAGDPSALPAALVADLFFRMAELGRARPIADADDRALDALPADTRADFAPPRAEREGDGARLEFWSERGVGGEIERWTVRVAPDGALSSTAQQVAPPSL